jgi:DNA-binding beta-propeller fold protein YncE
MGESNTGQERSGHSSNALPHKRAVEANRSSAFLDDLPTVYSEGLAPESDLNAYQRSMIQQQIAIQRLQQLQNVHGQHLQLPPCQEFPFGLPFDASLNSVVPSHDHRSILQQHMAFQAIQDQQQRVFQQQQLMAMQEQRSHQLMMLLQQEAQAQLQATPFIHPSFNWSFGLPNEAGLHPVAGSSSFSSPIISHASSSAAPSTNSISANPILSSSERSEASLAESNHRVPVLLAQPVSSKSFPAVHHLITPSPSVPKLSTKKAKKVKVLETSLSDMPMTIASMPRTTQIPLIGSGGKLAGQFDHPIGIAIDRGHIIVCDHDNHRVQVLRCWNGSHLNTFGNNRPSKNECGFHRPQGVVVDRDHNMIVTDQGNHRIQAINYTTGQHVFSAGTFGEGPTQFANPCGLALHPSGHIVVCDSGNHRLQILDAQGNFVRCIGTQGRDPGQFKSPLSVGCSLDGQLLIVAEYGNLRVQVLRWNDGSHVYTINKYFRPKISWCPSGIAIDKDGHALIVNSDCNCIEIFRIDSGHYVRTIDLALPTVATPITPDTQLSRPRGIALSEDLDIAVTDHGLNHVQVILKQNWYIDTQ